MMTTDGQPADGGQPAPLSEARLAEIRQQVDEYARKVFKKADVEFGFGLHELLSEVERLHRVRDAAMALWLAERERLLAVVRTLRTIRQAAGKRLRYQPLSTTLA